MASGIEIIRAKLKAYKKKYYGNQLIKGGIFTISFLLSLYVIFVLLEFSANFNAPVRTVLFFIYLAAALFLFSKYLFYPLYQLLSLKELSDEKAALQVGRFFPEIKDKLLNTIQLSSLNQSDSQLLAHEIQKRVDQLSVFRFEDSIPWRENVKYLKYSYPALLMIIIFLLFIPSVVMDGTHRIIHFDKEFIPKAPFTFQIESDPLQTYRNEDFRLEIKLEGSSVPDQLYIHTRGRKIKMNRQRDNRYEFTFNKIQEDIPFELEGAGFFSSSYKIKTLQRPSLQSMDIVLEYPAYLNKNSETISNAGNLRVPEGTKGTWQFNVQHVDSVAVHFSNSEERFILGNHKKSQFEKLNKTLIKSDQYSVSLYNRHGSNREKIQYRVDVIPDEHPEITLEQFQDTVMYRQLVLGGNISDDYGLTGLHLRYQIRKYGEEKTDRYKRKSIPINTSQNSQSYYFDWKLDSLQIKEGDQVHYYLEVFDNDEVNGFKSTRSGNYTFAVPTEEEIDQKIAESSGSAKDQGDRSVEKARELAEQIQNTADRMKGKNRMDWQDEQAVEDLLDKREDMERDLEKLKELYDAMADKQNRFKDMDERSKEKMQQLQKLIDDLMDDETKRLYEELKKMLDDKKPMSEYQKQLQQLRKKEQNLEKELERTMELFKRMQFDFKLDKNIKDLENLEKRQDENRQKTEQEKGKSSDEIKEQQKDIEKDFSDFRKEMEQLQDLNDQLKQKNDFSQSEEEQDAIEKKLQEINENLDKDQKKKATENQQDAQDRMKRMQQQMQDMQAGMEMEMAQENMDHLRDILDNLVKLSFNQERIMKDFRAVHQSDPRFVDLSQEQLKLKDDAKVIEDSLQSLANRVFQIQSFVTREVNDMNEHIDAALEELKERRKGPAIGKQQFAMTSMNNLALLLDDVLEQMQMQMAAAMGNPKMSKNPTESDGPSLSELQEMLNQRIEELKESGLSGRELSEELAKMAAEQEQLRQQMQEMRDKLEDKGDGGGGNADDAIKKMEESEMDLVNKKLTQELIMRQREILTRMLEAENSMREQEMDEEREGERAQEDYDRKRPEAFEDYIKAKEKEIELLRTVPLRLNPYYKREVNSYFQRLNQED